MLPSGELMVLNAGQADSFSTYECRVTHRLTGETKVSVRATRIQVTGKFYKIKVDVDCMGVTS